ncbi:hypothetical protein [Clostridium saccharoperbutylacetonicum]|uniref:hypothetical protein n=1 Tax=Clostridium saccharoperbutylacetonicum TaxID=36745 RepID=UPI0039EC5D56
MFTKIKRKILSFSLACAVIFSTSSLPVFASTKTTVTNTKPIIVESGKSIELKEGQTIRVPLKVQGAITDGTVIPMGDAGYIDFTRIQCYAEVTDISHGVSRGTSNLAMESGIVPYTPYSGQQYSLTINGYAYMLDKPVVSIYAKVFWVN